MYLKFSPIVFMIGRQLLTGLRCSIFLYLLPRTCSSQHCFQQSTGKVNFKIACTGNSFVTFKYMELMISCVSSLWLTYFDGTTSLLGVYITQTKSSGFFSQSIIAALQIVLSFLINSYSKKSLGLLDSMFTYL